MKESDATHSPNLNESSTGDENIHTLLNQILLVSLQTVTRSNVSISRLEKRGGVHGVIVQQHDNNQTWTPVYSKIRKRIPLSKAQLRKIPPHCCHPPPSDDDSSSESDTPLTCTIPENATVNYKVADGTPGLSITTRKTRHWTPIASRTRARTRTSATKS